MLDERARTALSKATCNVSQFAEIFGLSRNAAYEAIERGDVRAVRIGRRIVIPTAQLRKMLMLDEDTASAQASAA